MCFKKYTLLHPEEKPDYSITMSNYNLDVVFDKWLNDYQVPMDNWGYWEDRIKIEVTLNTPMYFDGTEYKYAPSATWETESGRRLVIRPEYLNAGILAHEQAHNSFALLNETDKSNFAIDLEELKKTNELIKYLFKVKPYAKTSYTEAHGEIYRYISVPPELRRYYPLLFST